LVAPIADVEQVEKSRKGFIQTKRWLFRLRSGGDGHDRFVGDFLVVLGILGFAAVMLGLIWALDRV
jgi:hypothetical protein